MNIGIEDMRFIATALHSNKTVTNIIVSKIQGGDGCVSTKGDRYFLCTVITDVVTGEIHCGDGFITMKRRSYKSHVFDADIHVAELEFSSGVHNSCQRVGVLCFNRGFILSCGYTKRQEVSTANW